MTTTTTRNTRLITRPRLVSYLMAHGVEVTPSPNPWRPDLHAWTVEDTQRNRALIDAYLAAERTEAR